MVANELPGSWSHSPFSPPPDAKSRPLRSDSEVGQVFFFPFSFFFGPESPARSLIWLRPSVKPPASQRSGQIKDSALALAGFRVKKEKIEKNKNPGNLLEKQPVK